MADNPLPGFSGALSRRRGRPPGAKNKRTADLLKFTDAAYGGSAAQQLGAFCMVTPRELQAAKGEMMRARVHKAMALRKIFIEETGETITHAQAMAMIADGLEKLMPYTDQRLAQLDLTSKGKALQGPTIVIADAGGLAGGGLAQGLGEVIDMDRSEYGVLEENQPLSLPGAG